VAVLAYDTAFHETIPTVFPHKPQMKDNFDRDEELRGKHAHFNATLQAGYFILAVRAHGLAAGPMTGFDAAAIDREFFPDGRHRTLVVVNAGKPGENAWFDRLPRLDYDEVVTAV
jgi:nitroreductase